MPRQLHATLRGNGRRLVLAHGFTHNSSSWGPFAALLARSCQILAADLPGHGRSAAVRADLRESARLLGEAGGRSAYLGYSMGGRVSLHLALERPDLVEALVLFGASPGIPDPAERERRVVHDEHLARSLEASTEAEPPSSTDDAGDGAERRRLEHFLREWLDNPLFATLPPDAAEVGARALNTCEGLASSLRLCGAGVQEPLWDRLAELDMPVLFVAGGLDARYCEIGRRVVEAIGPSARLELVPAAGHACHLEQPQACAATVLAFLAELD